MVVDERFDVEPVELVVTEDCSFVLSPPKSCSEKPPTLGKVSSEVVSWAVPPGFSNENVGPEASGSGPLSLFSKLVPKSDIVNPFLSPLAFFVDDCWVYWLDADCSVDCFVEDLATGRWLFAICISIA